MGINDLWPVLAPGFDERLPFTLWVSRFVAIHKRTPRIAIDGYMFLFQSRHSGFDEWTSDLIIHNFISKLVYFSSLNVTYVVVFDGLDKPAKTRNGGGILAGTGPGEYFDDSLISALKQQLKRYRIAYVQCPGEGEAECAMLQKTQLVDYVVSNDVDSLVFGATKMLRNFSRNKQDKPASSVGASTGEFYVTPVCMSQVCEKTGLDCNRLLLIATLRGGDYSNGVDNIGISRAVKLALCGTPFASFYHRSPTKIELKLQNAGNAPGRRSDPLPDFSRLLLDCFVDPFAPKGVRDVVLRKERLRRYLDLINECIAERSREIFERKTVLSKLSIDETFTIMYLFPRVSTSKMQLDCRKFSFGEETVNQVTPTEEFRFNVKYLILKLLSHARFKGDIIATKTKVVGGCQFVMIRFNGEKIYEAVFPTQDMSQEMIVEEAPGENDAVFDNSVWIPGNLVELVNPALLLECEIELQKKERRQKSSPSKKALQKTTLDMLFRSRRELQANKSTENVETEAHANEGESARENKKETQAANEIADIEEVVPSTCSQNVLVKELGYREEKEALSPTAMGKEVDLQQVQVKPSNANTSRPTMPSRGSLARIGSKIPTLRRTSLSKSPSKRRSPKKTKLLPGQSFVTSFFASPSKNETKIETETASKSTVIEEAHVYDGDTDKEATKTDNPFLDLPTLFIDSDSDSDSKPMPSPLKSAPQLSYKIPAMPAPSKRLISSSGLAETSPTKRANLRLSPDNSPQKPAGKTLPSVDVSPAK